MSKPSRTLVVLLAFGIVHTQVPGYEWMVRMRDGVKLHTEKVADDLLVWNKTATVLDRSPYGHSFIEQLTEVVAPYGLIGIGQDMRGTGQSEGNFTIWQNAADDTIDTMGWVVSQKWTDRSEVYTIGVSADGIAEFMMWENPSPYLKKQVVVWATADSYNTFYPGGAYRLQLIENWINGTIKTCSTCVDQIRDAEAPTSQLWKNTDWRTMKAVNSSSVHWAGWYDIFLQGHLLGYEILKSHSLPAVKDTHYIVVDPLGHCGDAGHYFQKDLINGRAMLPFDMAINLLMPDNVPTPSQNVKHITFYVMGPTGKDDARGNFWCTLDEWPKYTERRLYLTLDRALQFDPAPRGDVALTFNPDDPVPTIGGNNLFGSCGPEDQTPLYNRSDVLRFKSAPLTEHIAVTGPLKVELYVSTNCTDTDFTAKLVDLYPTGEARLIQDSIRRLRWRECEFDKPCAPDPVWAVPNKMYHITVDLWNTSYVFNKGHVIELDISSSNYPRFGVNHNAKGATVQNPGAKHIARNTVYVGTDSSGFMSSHLVLPTVEFVQIPRKEINPKAFPPLPWPPFKPPPTPGSGF